MINSDIIHKKDKLLFTPGPVTTAKSVKEASLAELGTVDSGFIMKVQQIRQKLLKLAHVESPEFEAVIIPGSGTYGIESTISSAIPSNGMLLNIVNGAYGRRISKIARIHSIPLKELIFEENQLPDLKEIEFVLKHNLQITHIAVVHGETSTGMLNPIAEIGELCARYNKIFIVDAMSTFGAYDIYLKELNISYLISGSGICIEGIPGFSFVLLKRTALDQCKYQVRSLSLDLYDQWVGLNTSGEFRFTPPVQALLTFNEALSELEKEGGINRRAERYSVNNALLVGEMRELGFEMYLPANMRSYIVTSFLYPDHPDFSFEKFSMNLNEKGFVISPGRINKTDCFRIANIGQLYPHDIQKLVDTIESVLYELKIELVEM
jgi:2-aminoethylphosphonate-pyruvate transaminase